MIEHKKDEFEQLVEAYIDFADGFVEMVSEKRICVCDCEKNCGKVCKYPEIYRTGGCK